MAETITFNRGDYVAVNKNTDLRLYHAAQLGDIVLFYSPAPMSVCYSVTEERFAGEYQVPSSKALNLRDLILKEKPPEEIISKLGLSKFPREQLKGFYEKQYKEERERNMFTQEFRSLLREVMDEKRQRNSRPPTRRLLNGGIMGYREI